jgi:hypothetical protein
MLSSKSYLRMGQRHAIRAGNPVFLGISCEAVLLQPLRACLFPSRGRGEESKRYRLLEWSICPGSAFT